MRILICGDKHWTDKSKMKGIVASLTNVVRIMHGNSIGADSIAQEIGEDLAIPVILGYPANWSRDGASAGLIRNRAMFNDRPDLVLVFHRHPSTCKNTKDIIAEANERGITTRIIR